MKYILSLFLLFNSFLFSQNRIDKFINLSEFKLCELTLKDLEIIDKNLTVVQVNEMDLCSDGFIQDSRYENGKGYVSKFYPGMIFQKDRDYDLISKISLTKEFIGNLPDGTFIDLSILTGEFVIKNNQKLYKGSTKDCSDYWSFLNGDINFYIKIDKSKEPKYPFDEKYYLDKPIEGIDIIMNCSEKLNQVQDSTEPLYIIDGKVVSKEDVMKCDPNSIETVTVLKDKVAITKYGEKGKNGVIEINTKKL